ncbi:MAG: hypothetical protein ACTTJS_03535 [Wolinella sp.]
MKKLTILLIVAIFSLVLVGCEDKSKQFGFGSGDCNEVQRNCINQCSRSGKSSAQCINDCEKARAMCAAIKVKGCMQDCNQRYGKGSQGAEYCKKRCQENGGVAF